MPGNTKHPLYPVWRSAINRPLNSPAPVCLRWRLSFEAFLSDVGERPLREHLPPALTHLDTFKEFGPGNFAWMDRTLMLRHLKKEMHRQLMKELGRPIPPYQPPERFLSCVQLDTRTQRKLRQVTVAANYRKLAAEGLMNHPASSYLCRQVMYKGERIAVKLLAAKTGVDYNRLRKLIQKGRSGDDAVAYILAHPIKTNTPKEPRV